MIVTFPVTPGMIQLHLTIVALFPNLGILFPPNVNLINNLIIESGHNNFSVECGENITLANTCIENFNAKWNFTDFDSFTQSSVKEVDEYLGELAESDCLAYSDCQNFNFARQLIVNSIRIFNDLKGIECLQNNGTDLEKSTHNCLKRYTFDLSSSDILENCTNFAIETSGCDDSEKETFQRARDESKRISAEYRLPSVFSSGVTNYISLMSCIMFLMFHMVMF
ncbi:hypothetical protein CRE_05951 [Caenorhabditis remanei]|uniref:Uncharacterized protein n=1 Tax=Caenorhabditis remanei TaxID=31234 RepID=E3MZF9_CAERE|nr:hypothetical protein CRE_05951 [Caenorhabditis remanei]